MSNFVMAKCCYIALYTDVGLPQDFSIGWAPSVAEFLILKNAVKIKMV